MASPFDDLDQLLSAAVSSAFGEAAILTPRASSQYVARAADPARQPATVHGVFSAGPAEAQIKGQTVGGEFQGPTRVGSVTSEFWLSPAQLQELGYRPQRGDKISFPGRPGVPSYAISGLQFTDRGDAGLILVREDQ